MFKLLIFLTTLFSASSVVSGNSYGWGYTKNKNNESPYIGIYEEEIDGTNSFYVGDENEKVVYLTFDAGYDNGNMIKILDTLTEKKVIGNFFITGDFITRFPELTKEIYNRGNVVGNHTWGHKNITKLSKSALKNELDKLNNAFYELTGDVLDPYFRPPAGVFNKESLLAVSEFGYNTIFWSVAYKDWVESQDVDINKAVDQVIENLHNGAIILLHTVSNQNVKALPEIIDKIMFKGYKIKSLNYLFKI